MGNYISGTINNKNYAATYSTDLIINKSDLPEQEIDDDYHIAANYFLKYAADPKTPNEIRKTLNDIIGKNPNLISEMLHIVHEATQTSTHHEAQQKAKQDAPNRLETLELQRQKLKADQKQMVKKIQTNIQSWQIKLPPPPYNLSISTDNKKAPDNSRATIIFSDPA